MPQRSELQVRPHPLLWVICGLGLILTVWLGFVVSALAAVGAQTGIATVKMQSGISAVQGKAAGQAVSDFGSAQRRLSSATSILENPAMKPLGWIPGISALYESAVAGYSGSARLAGAAVTAGQMLGIAQGVGGQEPMMTSTQIDIDRLPSLQTPLQKLTVQVDGASREFQLLPEAPVISSIKRALVGQTETAHEQLQAVAQMWPVMPTALGAQRPQQYLVAVLNPAELFPTGGPPLAVTAVTLDKGEIQIVKAGQVSSDIFPQKPGDEPATLQWEHVPGNPFYDGPTGEAVFVNSNLHPDFRVSGVEMARAWEAGGGGRVDGVIAIDARAIQAILGATGPVDVQGQDPLTADNLEQRLLINAYTKEGSGSREAVKERHATNNALMAFVTRSMTLQSLPRIAFALLDLGPARHFQVALANQALQEPLASIEVTGALTEVGPDTDYFAVFTTSSPNKVAIYQDRSVQRTVQLNADGGATVRQVVTLANTAPPSPDATLTGRGYRDQRAINSVAVYVPTNALNAQMNVADEHPSLRTPQAQLITDIGGRTFLQSRTAADPGQESVLTVTYSLPPGTFTNTNGNLTYRAVADPQPMWPVPTITTTVTGPNGDSITPEPPNAYSGLMSTSCNGTRDFIIPQGCAFSAESQR